MKYTLAIAALLASTSAVKIAELNKHACDFIEDNGEETSTSLMPRLLELQGDLMPPRGGISFLAWNP